MNTPFVFIFRPKCEGIVKYSCIDEVSSNNYNGQRYYIFA